MVETGLALLAKSKLSLNYWVVAFNVVVYLINRLNTIGLKNQSPYVKLFIEKSGLFSP